MSGAFDWHPGTKNQHGVYAPVEVLRLLRDGKGWRGVARCEIELVQTSDGWRGRANFNFFTGNHWGSSGPLCDRLPTYATRDDAIGAAVGHFRHQFATLTDASMQREAREILAWADALMPAQLDLFGVAA